MNRRRSVSQTRPRLVAPVAADQADALASLYTSIRQQSTFRIDSKLRLPKGDS